VSRQSGVRTPRTRRASSFLCGFSSVKSKGSGYSGAGTDSLKGKKVTDAAVGLLTYIYVTFCSKLWKVLQGLCSPAGSFVIERFSSLSPSETRCVVRSTPLRYGLIYSTYSFSLLKQENTGQNLHKPEKQIHCMQVFPYAFLYYLPKGKKKPSTTTVPPHLSQ